MKSLRLVSAPVIWAALSLLGLTRARAADELFYIGTYTSGEAKGIYSARLDLETGALSAPILAVETTNPAWVGVSANGKFVYACNEMGTFQGKPTGSVTAATLSADGTHLRILNQESSGGEGPCQFSFDHAGENIFVANYGGGTVASLPINSDGSLGAPTSVVQHVGASVNHDRQDRPHAHEIISDPQGEYVYCADLGLDRVKVYHFDRESRTLVPAPDRDVVVKPGTGPRHLAFNPAGDRLYVLGELASDLTVYKIDSNSGRAEVIQNLSVLPADWKGTNLAAEIQIDRSGKHLYASNRGDDTLVVFSFTSDGQVKLEQRISSGGKSPRNFSLDPSGRYLLAANQNSASVAAFRVNAETGKLEALDSKLSVGRPVSIAFQP